MLLHFKNVRNFPKWFKLLGGKAHWSERSAKINRHSKMLPALKMSGTSRNGSNRSSKNRIDLSLFEFDSPIKDAACVYKYPELPEMVQIARRFLSWNFRRTQFNNAENAPKKIGRCRRRTCVARTFERHFLNDSLKLSTLIDASGHTATNTPDLFRTLKLTVAGPG